MGVIWHNPAIEKPMICRYYLTFMNSFNLAYPVPARSTSQPHCATVLYGAGTHNIVGFTMATEIIRQRSGDASVEVSRRGQGGGGGEGSFSIHWARSSSPVLHQLPTRLVRVNKPSVKVKDTYKVDIMQTAISVDLAEPQIEWHNHLCSFSIWKWITESCTIFFLHRRLMNWLWAVDTPTQRTLWI